MDEREETDDPQLFFPDWAQERSQFLCSVFPAVCRAVVSFLALVLPLQQTIKPII